MEEIRQRFDADVERFSHLEAGQSATVDAPLALALVAAVAAATTPHARHVLDGTTVVLSPHKVYGASTNDLVLQLRKRRLEQVVLAGPAGNLCVEAHLRDLLEHGFEIAMVRDAIGGTANEEGDGVQAALVNFRFLAHALWTTDEAVARFVDLSR